MLNNEAVSLLFESAVSGDLATRLERLVPKGKFQSVSREVQEGLSNLGVPTMALPMGATTRRTARSRVEETKYTYHIPLCCLELFIEWQNPASNMHTLKLETITRLAKDVYEIETAAFKALEAASKKKPPSLSTPLPTR